ncbi:MAG: YraN family protein [Clostridia bacterium]|nr:YraN family protein [Clostridia bacterium]
MKRYNKNLGDFGEEAAKNYLIEKGYEIVEQNFNVKGGEIDIVCMDGNVLVFVEVKTRNSKEYGLPIEAIDKKKREHLRFAAERYFQLHPTDCEIRFDGIEVYASMTDGVPVLFEINHIVDFVLD